MVTSDRDKNFVRDFRGGEIFAIEVDEVPIWSEQVVDD